MVTSLFLKMKKENKNLTIYFLHSDFGRHPAMSFSIDGARADAKTFLSDESGNIYIKSRTFKPTENGDYSFSINGDEDYLISENKIELWTTSGYIKTFDDEGNIIGNREIPE